MRLSVTVILCVVLMSSFSAYGQTACPVGVAAGSAQCGPSPAEHQRPVSPPPAQIQYVPTGEWVKTWGAISSDKATGDIGVAVGKFSKSEAEREAVSQCSGLGSSNCDVVLTYENQRAVIASAEPGTGGNVIFQSSFPVDDAKRLAMPKCVKGKAGNTCKIVYSACAEQVFRAY